MKFFSPKHTSLERAFYPRNGNEFDSKWKSVYERTNPNVSMFRSERTFFFFFFTLETNFNKFVYIISNIYSSRNEERKGVSNR